MVAVITMAWIGFNGRISEGAAAEPATKAPAPILANLSFEQLSQIKITTASKREETLANTPAAVTVLRNADILRSGATSIPEALRWVPGLDVAQINSAEWAITSRGFNGRFSNKLLVMVDGRSIYTPLLAGVYWDAVNPMLEDLERIEVVRGPGGTLWGANAVNGVINILSKPAAETQGTLIYGGAGREKLAMGGARHGFALNDHTSMRVYASYHRQDESQWSNGAAGRDGWDSVHAGFRLDAEPAGPNRFTLQGDSYSAHLDRISQLVTATGVATLTEATHATGSNVLGRWVHDAPAGGKFTLQAYYDHMRRDSALIGEIRDTIDVDAQHEWEPGERQTLTWGLGYRWSGDQTTASALGGFVPEDYAFELFSAFVQDEITLLPERLKFTLGTKLEHNSFTGYELQPGARLLWTPSGQQTWWASVARAVRNPNRVDTGGRINAFFVPAGPNPGNPSPLPMLVRALGDPAIASESVVACEAGWRMQVTPQLSADLAVFYSDYEELILGVPNPAGTFLEPTPAPAHLVLPAPLRNAARAHSWGGELAVTWQPAASVRFAPFYSHLQINLTETVPGAQSLVSLETSAPEHQFGLRCSFDLADHLTLDVNLRHIGAVPGYSVASYTEADIRIAWEIRDGLELAVTGQNLLASAHDEFGPQTIEPRYELQRGVYAKLSCRF